MTHVNANNLIRASEFVAAYDFPQFEIKDQFLSDPLYNAIIQTRHFQRLFHIAHLGGLSYLDRNRKGKTNTRGDHSIGVALLAHYFCQLSALPKNTQHSFVVSALLHDIHHLPFSHTMDLALKNELRDFSLFHETQKIIFNRSSGHIQSIGDILHKYEMGRKLLPLFKPRSKRPLIFGSTHNIDTLDGIIRAQAILFAPNVRTRLLPTRIVEIMSDNTSSGKTPPDDVLAFDDFWEIKNHVYTQGIYEPSRVLFERVIGYYLFDLCKEKGILHNITEYTDDDLLQMFSSLSEKMDKLWEYITYSSTFAVGEGRELGESNDPSPRNAFVFSREEKVVKFMINTRHFVINRKKEVVARKLSSLKQRYHVKADRKILIVSTNIVKDIEALLEYPLLSKRFSKIARQADEYLL